jgi:hypothetical protein
MRAIESASHDSSFWDSELLEKMIARPGCVDGVQDRAEFEKDPKGFLAEPASGLNQE